MKMMNVLILILGMVLPLSGCTKIHYNPQTHDFDYVSPPWGKKVGKVSVLREADGSILFEMEDYETEKLGEIAGKVAEGVAAGLPK